MTDADGPYCTWPRVSRYVHIVYPMAGAWVHDKAGVRQLSREELRPLNEAMTRHLERSMEGDFTTENMRYRKYERAAQSGAPLSGDLDAPNSLSRFISKYTWHLPDDFRGVRYYRSPEVLAGAPAHEFLPHACICKHCGATEIAIEDGRAPAFCPENR